jgi:hypothetical protein
MTRHTRSDSTRPVSHTSGVGDTDGGREGERQTEAGKQGPERTGWNHRSSVDPRREHYSTASSMPWLVTTTVHLGRWPRIYSVFCRVKLLAFYTVFQAERRRRHRRGFEGPWRPPAGSGHSAMMWLIGEPLQKFAAPVEQLAHRALVGLPMDLSQTDAAMHASTEWGTGKRSNISSWASTVRSTWLRKR